MGEVMSDCECDLELELTLLRQQCNSLEIQVSQHVQQIRRLFVLFGVLVALSSGVNIYGSEPGSVGRISPQFLDLILLLAGGGSAVYGVAPGRVQKQEAEVIDDD